MSLPGGIATPGGRGQKKGAAPRGAAPFLGETLPRLFGRALDRFGHHGTVSDGASISRKV